MTWLVKLDTTKTTATHPHGGVEAARSSRSETGILKDQCPNFSYVLQICDKLFLHSVSPRTRWNKLSSLQGAFWWSQTRKGNKSRSVFVGRPLATIFSQLKPGYQTSCVLLVSETTLLEGSIFCRGRNRHPEMTNVLFIFLHTKTRRSISRTIY